MIDLGLSDEIAESIEPVSSIVEPDEDIDASRYSTHARLCYAINEVISYHFFTYVRPLTVVMSIDSVDLSLNNFVY